MDRYTKDIITIEKNTRIAFTKKYPVLLPFVLIVKRVYIFLTYTLNPRYKIAKHDQASRWFNLTEHSSSLYRKYNKKSLDEGKIENIKIAIAHIDELVISPGQIFSFWKCVGKPSEKRGFKNGLVVSNDHLAEDIGGGLCQLSNLVAYMFACTECTFVQRQHHSKDIFPDSGRTVPFASGATIFFNLIDLQIQNTYSFPIKINLRTTDTQLRGSISGPHMLDQYVKLEERNACFIKSTNTGIAYRCNMLYRVFYSKISKQKNKEVLLWKNVAQVMYEKEDIVSSIITFP